MTVETDLALANRALSLMGARATIEDLYENSPEARAVRLHFDPLRQEMLRRGRWNFARKTAALHLLKTAEGLLEDGIWTDVYPMPPWKYEYGYPTDCLQAHHIVEGSIGNLPALPFFSNMPYGYSDTINGAPISFIVSSGKTLVSEVMTKVILTNQASALLVYTADVSESVLWDAHFESAFVAGLAARVTMPLTGDLRRTQTAMEYAELQFHAARVGDGNEAELIKESIPEWLNVRGVSNFTV